MKRPMRILPVVSMTYIVLVMLAFGAQTSPGQNQVPVIKTNARTVLVDVVVTKGRGDSVPGLLKEDFVLTEDGKPQSIDYFEEHGTKTLPAETAKSPAPLPPNVYSNIPPALASDSVNILLIDTLNTELTDQPFVRANVLKFLKQMKPGTRVAIFSLGAQFRFVQGFTSDVSLLQEALNNKKNGPETAKDPSFYSRSDQAWDAWELGAAKGLAAQLGGNMDVLAEGTQAAQAEAIVIQYKRRVSMTLAALDSIARYLAGVPGRKNLIWFASSFPVTVFPNSSEREQMNNLHLSLGDARNTADLLFTSKVAVYPVSAEGMMNNHSMDAEHCLPHGPGDSCPDAGVGSGLMDNISVESNSRAGLQLSMERLANDTGGKAFYNTNDLNDAMQQAIADGSHYYTLGYTPTNDHMNGEYRKINVKLTRGDYRLAYRPGYNATDTRTTVEVADKDPLRPLLARDLPDITELLYGVRAVPVPAQPVPVANTAVPGAKLMGKSTRYVIQFLIPWTDVSFHLTQNGNHSGQISFGVVAYDGDGKAIGGQGQTEGMDLTPQKFEEIKQSGVPAHMELDLPDKDVYLETGIYDWTTKRAGTLGIPLHLGEASSSLATAPSESKIQ
jgi:VWFA-related protein